MLPPSPAPVSIKARTSLPAGLTGEQRRRTKDGGEGRGQEENKPWMEPFLPAGPWELLQGPAKSPALPQATGLGRTQPLQGEIGRLEGFGTLFQVPGDLWQQEQHLSLSVRALQSRFPAAAAHGACEQRRGKQSRREGSHQGKEPGAPAAPSAAPGLKVAPTCQFKTCPGSANEPG